MWFLRRCGRVRTLWSTSQCTFGVRSSSVWQRVVHRVTTARLVLDFGIFQREVSSSDSIQESDKWLEGLRQSFYTREELKHESPPRVSIKVRELTQAEQAACIGYATELHTPGVYCDLLGGVEERYLLPCSWCREVVLHVVQLDGTELYKAARHLRADKTVVLRAVSTTGPALQFASAELRDDADVAWEAPAGEPLGIQVCVTSVEGEPRDGRVRCDDARSQPGARHLRVGGGPSPCPQGSVKEPVCSRLRGASPPRRCRVHAAGFAVRGECDMPLPAARRWCLPEPCGEGECEGGRVPPQGLGGGLPHPHQRGRAARGAGPRDGLGWGGRGIHQGPRRGSCRREAHPQGLSLRPP
eukprot:Sspe_Gene.342::Locus_119_Transcript_2_2_Confidence_0.600_Length_3293::g.342::m.342